MDRQSTKHIGIIGAGPAGLAALKSVLDTPQYKAGLWIPTAFEARENVGGVWLPSPPDHIHPPPTPLYDSLTTNLPHPIMAFSSFAFPPSTPLFPKAAVVQTYLEAFAAHFHLHPHIHLNTRVQGVRWDEITAKWVVTTTSSNHHEFDMLIICNGHHNLPRYPSAIPGLSAWLSNTNNLASHSMFYRNPSSLPLGPDISQKTILVVGGGPSGLDITADLLGVAARVVHSSTGYTPSPNPPSTTTTLNSPTPTPLEPIHKPRPTHFDAPTKRVTFADGTHEVVDYCILATGYEVDYPFFDQRVGVVGGPSPTSPPDDDDDDDGAKFTLPKRLSAPIALSSNKPQSLTNSTWGVAPLARHLFPFPGFYSPSGSGSGSPPSVQDQDQDQFVEGSHQQHQQPQPHPTTLAFLGLLVRVAPLPLVEAQARAALAAFGFYAESVPANQEQEQEQEQGEQGEFGEGEMEERREGEGIDWPAEHTALLARYEVLRAKYRDAAHAHAHAHAHASASAASASGTTGTAETAEEDNKEADKEAEEAYISKQWCRFDDQEQFDYRDALDELACRLSSSPSALMSSSLSLSSAPSTPSAPPPSTPSTPPLNPTPPWARALYPHKAPLRHAWRALEAQGVAEAWVRGVGLGGTLSEEEDGDGRRKRLTPEEEWVGFMWRVLGWWEGQGQGGWGGRRRTRRARRAKFEGNCRVTVKEEG
ncbi:hypothetical protein BDZ97DRAFT_2021939 [Flammula alnicola]|nr:hypothetical protein BDZ97DRAFT_2021939 [Flammula alnicola]